MINKIVVTYDDNLEVTRNGVDVCKTCLDRGFIKTKPELIQIKGKNLTSKERLQLDNLVKLADNKVLFNGKLVSSYLQ